MTARAVKLNFLNAPAPPSSLVRRIHAEHLNVFGAGGHPPLNRDLSSTCNQRAVEQRALFCRYVQQFAHGIKNNHLVQEVAPSTLTREFGIGIGANRKKYTTMTN